MFAVNSIAIGAALAKSCVEHLSKARQGKAGKSTSSVANNLMLNETERNTFSVHKSETEFFWRQSVSHCQFHVSRFTWTTKTATHYYTNDRHGSHVES
jgi:hypothetical protein